LTLESYLVSLLDALPISGFDYVLLDGEHGWVYRDLPHLIVTAQAFGITPVFRIPANDRGWILPALEAGVGGIWAPMVRHEQEARDRKSTRLNSSHVKIS